MFKRDYDAITGIMTLDDGSIFLCLTREQKVIFAENKPKGHIWHTTMDRVINLTSDIYVGARVYEENRESVDYHLYEIHNNRNETEAAHYDKYAWCVPIEAYNDPKWGDCTP